MEYVFSTYFSQGTVLSISYWLSFKYKLCKVYTIIFEEVKIQRNDETSLRSKHYT